MAVTVADLHSQKGAVEMDVKNLKAEDKHRRPQEKRI
jgi:hypothetical protein